MKLNREDYKYLQLALRSAFPDKESLKQMVRFQLNENVDVIAGGATQSSVIFNLIEWAESYGKLEELIIGAYLEKVNTFK